MPETIFKDTGLGRGEMMPLEERVVQLEKELAELKWQVSARRNPFHTRIQKAIEQFEKVIVDNKLSFKESTSLFRWARYGVFNDGMPTNEDNPIPKDQ